MGWHGVQHSHPASYYIPANETTHFTGGSAGELQFIAVSLAGTGVITLDTFDGG